MVSLNFREFRASQNVYSNEIEKKNCRNLIFIRENNAKFYFTRILWLDIGKTLSLLLKADHATLNTEHNLEK